MTIQDQADAKLPRNLHLTKGKYFSYCRPDTMQRIGVGTDREAAVDVANALNELFGVGDYGRAYGIRNLYRRTAFERVGSVSVPDWIKPRLPDLFPTEHESHASEAWARSPHETRFRGSRFIRYKEAHDGKLPDWGLKLYSQTRKNAAKRGIPFSLSEEDLIVLILRAQGRCEVSGVRLRLDEISIPGKRGRRPWAPSIDRIDSVGGYELGNCRLVCVAANLSMGMWGEEVLLTLAKGLARRHLTKPR